MARKYKAATAKEVLAYMDGQKAYALGIEECPRLVIYHEPNGNYLSDCNWNHLLTVSDRRPR